MAKKMSNVDMASCLTMMLMRPIHQQYFTAFYFYSAQGYGV